MLVNSKSANFQKFNILKFNRMSGIPFSDDVSGRVMYNHVKDTPDITQFYIIFLDILFLIY